MKAAGYRLQATVSNQNRNVPFSVKGLRERGAGPRARHPRCLADSVLEERSQHPRGGSTVPAPAAHFPLFNWPV